MIRLFAERYRFSSSGLKKESEDIYNSFLKIKGVLSPKRFSKEDIWMYHAGARTDLLSSLALYDAFIEKNKTLNMVLLDIRDFSDFIIPELKACTSKSIISSKKSEKKTMITAKFRDRTFNIIYYTKDFNTFFPHELCNNIDIYHERAFELFRRDHPEAMKKVYENLNIGGFLISDRDFEFTKEYKDKFISIDNIPKDFGFYGKFQIWQKIA